MRSILDPVSLILRSEIDCVSVRNCSPRYKEACITQNPLRLGEAATLSAIASQTLLPKPGFTALLSLVEECDLYGLNVAHSGSVVGLMLDRKRHDIARLKGKLAEKKLTRHWPKQHLLKMVTGGVKLQ